MIADGTNGTLEAASEIGVCCPEDAPPEPPEFITETFGVALVGGAGGADGDGFDPKDPLDPPDPDELEPVAIFCIFASAMNPPKAPPPELPPLEPPTLEPPPLDDAMGPPPGAV